MKIIGHIGLQKVKLEVYKVQVSIFGTPAVLIYNEDRSQSYEETNPNNIKAIRDFIGKNTLKCYIAGNMNSDGKIVFQKVIPNNISKDYNW